jgi:hypothetical protein
MLRREEAGTVEAGWCASTWTGEDEVFVVNLVWSCIA